MKRAAFYKYLQGYSMLCSKANNIMQPLRYLVIEFCRPYWYDMLPLVRCPLTRPSVTWAGTPIVSDMFWTQRLSIVLVIEKVCTHQVSSDD